MPFLIFNNEEIQFIEKELTWRFYISEEAIPTTRWVELINKKKFAKLALDENIKVFVIHIASFTSKILIYSAWKAQITLLIAKEFIMPAEYADFANVLLKKSAKLLLGRTSINNHIIKLIDDKQLLYEPIYNIGLIELEILKTYIKTNLVNNFIWPSKSPAWALILFVRKPNDSLRLYVDYWGLNNLTIKNQYPLPLIGKSLDWLEQAKQFTQLDFTSAYH